LRVFGIFLAAAAFPGRLFAHGSDTGASGSAGDRLRFALLRWQRALYAPIVVCGGIAVTVKNGLIFPFQIPMHTPNAAP